MIDQKLTHAYLGVRPCGHVMYMGVDDGSKDLGKDLAKLIAQGNTVERVTIEEARTRTLYCACEQSADYVAKQRRRR